MESRRVIVTEISDGEDIELVYTSPVDQGPWRRDARVVPREVLVEKLDALRRARAKYNDALAAAAARSDLDSLLRQLVVSTTEVTELARPERGGLLDVAGRSEAPIQLMLDVVGPLAAQIPWEALEEPGFRCQACLEFCGARGTSTCVCGGRLVEAREPLSVCARLAHVSSSPSSANRRGSTFIVVEDPGGDLYANPHGERARFHNEAICQLLEEAKYTVKRYGPQAPSPDELKQLLQDPNVIGFYYFGHATRSNEKGGSYLQLWDVERDRAAKLSAAEIAKCSRIPFVFLNGCEAALGKLSLAAAFGGVEKLVIAPPFVISSEEAAQLAWRFFRLVIKEGASIDTAWARACSEHRLEHAGAPCWPHRLLGDPRRPFPKPAQDTQGAFERGQLDVRKFGFDIERVVLAARRGRAQQIVNASDLLSGLIAAGEVTPRIVRDLVLDPEVILRRNGHEAARAALPVQSNLSERSFDNLARLCFNGAAERALAAGDVKISELALLQELLQQPAWNHWKVSDARTDELLARARVWSRSVTPIDGNGKLDLSDLSEGAHAIIMRALSEAESEEAEEAERLGRPPGERVVRGKHLFRAFWADPQCCLAQCLSQYRKRGQVSAPSREFRRSASPLKIGLAGWELMAMLAEARSKGASQITISRMFMAFCRTASRETVNYVKDVWVAEGESGKVLRVYECVCTGPRVQTLPPEVKPRTVDRCDEAAQQVLLRFAQLAVEVNSCSNRLLMAAFLDQVQARVAKPLDALLPADRKELSEFLIDRSRSAAAALNVSELYDRMEKLVNAAASKRPISASALLTAFGRSIPPEFAAGLKTLKDEKWRDLELSWMNDS